MSFKSPVRFSSPSTVRCASNINPAQKKHSSTIWYLDFVQPRRTCFMRAGPVKTCPAKIPTPVKHATPQIMQVIVYRQLFYPVFAQNSMSKTSVIFLTAVPPYSFPISSTNGWYHDGIVVKSLCLLARCAKTKCRLARNSIYTVKMRGEDRAQVIARHDGPSQHQHSGNEYSGVTTFGRDEPQAPTSTTIVRPSASYLGRCC